MDFYSTKFAQVGKVKESMTIIETEIGIKIIKDTFQKNLADNLNLLRVSAPLYVKDESGLNDDLSGVERKVNIEFKCGVKATIAQSLAKWKRFALYQYKIPEYTGIYTDMNAIRIDEDLSNIHSYYVDQWDWEIVIKEEDRNVNYLKQTVENIYDAVLKTDSFIRTKYSHLTEKLPAEIHFISSQELENMYPDLSAKEREYNICKKYKAVFIMQIGGKLISGERHDGRAPDYDDWSLNGDIMLYNSKLDIPFELSSMGIRVSKESLEAQLKELGCEGRKRHNFHKMLLDGLLPFTVGGGIGQSRLCLFLLDKVHIGEVQVSEWDEYTKKYCEERNIFLL